MAQEQSQGQTSGFQANQGNQGGDPKLDARVREIQKGNGPKQIANTRRIREKRERYLRNKE